MKKFITVVALMCAVAFQANAQMETPMQKCDRIVKTANDDPTNWKKQLDAGHTLLEKEQIYYNMEKAMTFYERIHKMAVGADTNIPDSVVNEVIVSLMLCSSNQGDVDKMKFYCNEMIRHDLLQHRKETSMSIMARSWTAMLEMIDQDYATALADIERIQRTLKDLKYGGVEHTEVMKTILFESYLAQYRKQMQDKLMEVTIDGKKYILIGTNIWNVEQPFVGWEEKAMMDEDESIEEKRVFYGEDGRVYDELHGQISFSFDWQEKDRAVKPREDANTRLITVSPAERKKMVDAYKAYLKNKK